MCALCGGASESGLVRQTLVSELCHAEFCTFQNQRWPPSPGVILLKREELADGVVPDTRYDDRYGSREDEEAKKTRQADMELGGTTSTKRSQIGPMEPPDHDGPLPLGPSVPTDINQKVNQLLQPHPSIRRVSAENLTLL